MDPVFTPESSNPLLGLHHQAGAEMQPYDRLEIVSTFGEPQAEYAAIRKGCALLDEPYRGILELAGKDRHAFLNNLLTNQTWDKTRKAGPVEGQGVYAFFLNLKGRIVADMNVLERGDRTYLETDARLVEPLREAFEKYRFAEQVTMTPRAGSLHRLTLHGPDAPPLIQALSGSSVADLKPLGSVAVRLFDAEVTVFRDDMAGVPGLHLIVDTARASDVWRGLLAPAGERPESWKRRVWPAGWAAFNATRIEGGRPLFGIDFEGAPVASAFPARKQREEQPAEASGGPGVLPAETGQLHRAVSFTKGCYLGQEIVARMHARAQVARQLVGFQVDGDSLPVAGAPVFDPASPQNPVGVVTSSTVSPVLSRRAIGFAFVKKPFTPAGSTVLVPAEGAVRRATVVALPFVGGGSEAGHGGVK
jgi:aminomethyltransferase